MKSTKRMPTTAGMKTVFAAEAAHDVARRIKDAVRPLCLGMMLSQVLDFDACVLVPQARRIIRFGELPPDVHWPGFLCHNTHRRSNVSRVLLDAHALARAFIQLTAPYFRGSGVDKRYKVLVRARQVAIGAVHEARTFWQTMRFHSKQCACSAPAMKCLRYLPCWRSWHVRAETGVLPNEHLIQLCLLYHVNSMTRHCLP